MLARRGFRGLRVVSPANRPLPVNGGRPLPQKIADMPTRQPIHNPATVAGRRLLRLTHDGKEARFGTGAVRVLLWVIG